MALWLGFALMTAAAVLAVLWPLSRRGGVAGGSELAVYRDQLDEIERDRADGLIDAVEADGARVEVSRRLIAAADAEASKPQAPAGRLWLRRATALAGLALLPVGAGALYLLLGSPGLPGAPLAGRIEAAHQGRSIETMVAQVEEHLARNPNDARGYEVLAPVYLRLGRINDAVNARRQIIAIAGENADRQADLGEALVAAANGVVTAEAKSAFERALQLDPNELKSRFFTGLAAEQDGDKRKAADIWGGMLEKASPDAPWVSMVREALVRVGGAPPTARGPSAQDMAAAGTMSEQDRNEMIRGMVAQLADRLKQNGDDIEGWQRLVRAYVVLGDRDKARAAAADAKRALARDPDKLNRIDGFIKTLGIEG